MERSWSSGRHCFIKVIPRSHAETGRMLRYPFGQFAVSRSSVANTTCFHLRTAQTSQRSPSALDRAATGQYSSKQSSGSQTLGSLLLSARARSLYLASGVDVSADGVIFRFPWERVASKP